MRPVAPKRLPWGLTAADVSAVAPELVEARYLFVRAYACARGWPEDPARLTADQLQEIINAKEWPQ